MLTKFKGLSFYDANGMPVLPEPRGDVSTGAWFGSEVLKANTVEKMRKHREQDQIVQGLYQTGFLTGDDDDDEFKGCLVGCTLPPMNAEWYNRLIDTWDSGWHDLVERFYNIQEALAQNLDNQFEERFEGDAPEFAVDALEAIPVGAIYSEEDFDAMSLVGDGDSDAFLEILRNPSIIIQPEPVNA